MGFLDRFSRKSKAAAKSKQDETDLKYRGVEVVSDPASRCAAASAIEGRRFLTASAPLLPLKECDVKDCRCTYKRFNDRRTDSRRASDVAFDITGQNYRDEKREYDSPGRRSTD